LSNVADTALDGCLLLGWVTAETMGEFYTWKESNDSNSLSIVFEYGNNMDDLVAAEFWATQREHPNENHNYAMCWKRKEVRVLRILISETRLGSKLLLIEVSIFTQ
jgi:hypothetical protein